MQIFNITIGRCNNNYNKQNEQSKALATPVVQKPTTLPNYQVAFGLLIQHPCSDKANQYKVMRKELEDSLNADPNFYKDNTARILQYTNEQNILLAKQLCVDPDLHKDEIEWILQYTNEQNIAAARLKIYNVLKNDPKFPKDNIEGILESTNEQNIAAKLKMYNILKNDPNTPKNNIARILQSTNEQNIAAKLKMYNILKNDPNTPKDNIASILQSTNEQNIAAKLEIYNLLKNDLKFPKDNIAGILQHTNEQNIALAQQICADPKFPNDEIIGILQSTNEQNIAAKLEIYNLLKNDPKFPKDSIADILYTANEQNISLAQQICADPNFPKDSIADILCATNKKNISLAQQLCADPEFFKDNIGYILQTTNDQNISAKLEMYNVLKNNPKFPRNQIAMLLMCTNEQNISLAKQICADPKFPKDTFEKVLNSTNEKNISAKLEMYNILKNAPNFPKDKMLWILVYTNEQNISLTKQLCADTKFPKDNIAGILQHTNEQNISFAKQLCVDPNFPKDKIIDILSRENEQNIPKLEMYNILKNNPNFPKDKTVWILQETNEKNISSLKQLIAGNFHQEMITRRHILKSGTEDLIDAKIYAFIAKNANNLVAAKEILGDSAIIDSFGLKLEGMENLLAKCGILKRKLPPEQYEQILQVFNPTQSKKGQRIVAIVQKLKEQNQELAKIPDLSIKKPKMDHRSKRLKNLKTKITELQAQIKGMSPNEKFTKLKVIAAIAENDVNDVPEFTKLLTADKQVWNSAVNKKCFEILGLDFNQEVSSKLKLANSEYISEILSGDSDFKENFKSLVEVIAKYPDKTIQESLDTLPQNIETKKVFDKLGLDYNKWVSVDKNSFERVVITTDSQKAQQAAISSMEADFNDAAFHSLPKSETDKILKALKENNITLKEVTEVIYDNAGFEKGTRNVLKLYYNDKPIEFAQLGKAIKVMKEVMNKEAFWSTEHRNEAINQAKNTVYEHITKLRDNEVNIANKQKGETTTEIEVRKTDMNNISHSLFLGNHGACCTAVGTGFNQFSAPTYIKNKLISAIEVVDGKNFVGNTMCYIAEVDGKPALVLDNIELNAQYQYNDAIRDAMFKYAQRLTTEIGAPDMPIYAGPHRHKVNMPASTLKERTVKILGSTAEDEIYIDYQGRYTVNGNNTLTNKFYKISN